MVISIRYKYLISANDTISIVSENNSLCNNFDLSNLIIQSNESSELDSVRGDKVKCYYRTTGTSPFMPLMAGINSTSNPVSNGAHPSFDDFESEDDLDKEDIAFTLDAGKYSLIEIYK